MPKNPSLLTLDTMDFSNRSKQHANKIHKNQQQKSQQQLPVSEQSTSTTTSSTTKPAKIPFTTPNSHIPAHPHTEILFTVTPKSQTSNLSPPNRQRQKTTSAGAGSLQSLEDVETISDESRNIQVTQQRDQIPSVPSTTYRTKVIIYRPKEAFASSPRPNLVRENSEKVYKEKSSLESGKSYESFKGSAEYSSRSTERNQIKHLQTYLLSDVRPQSFKPAPVFETEEQDENDESNNESSSASSTLRNMALLNPKPFQYSLKTGSNGFNLQIENRQTGLESNTEAYYPGSSKQIFTTTTFRSPTTSTLSTTTRTHTTTTTPLPTTTTTTRKTTTTPVLSTTSPYTSSEPFYLDEFVPTTLLPSTRFWKNGRPTVKSNSIRLQATPSTKTRETVFLDSKNPTTNPPVSATTTTTERPIQSFTARATLFKDNLVRTTPNPAQRFVSPYKSLETLLGEPEKSSRTTSRPRYTSPVSTPTPFAMSTKAPLRSYFVITSAPKVLNDAIVTMSTNPRNFSISDTILRTFSNITMRSTSPIASSTESIHLRVDTKSTLSTTPSTTIVPSSTSTTLATTTVDYESITVMPKYKLRESSSNELNRQRGRSRYTLATKPPNESSDEPGTIDPKIRTSISDSSLESYTPRGIKPNRRKLQRARIVSVHGHQPRYLSDISKSKEKYQSYKAEQRARDSTSYLSKSQNRKPIENESAVSEGPRAEALVAFPLDTNQDNSIEGSRGDSRSGSSSSTEQVVAITDRPLKQFYSNKYRQQTVEHTLAEGLQNAGYITSSTGRSKYRPKSVLEQLQEFLAGESEENNSEQKDFEDNFTHPEIKAAVQEIKNLYTSSTLRSPITTSTPSSTTSPSPSNAENTHTTTRYASTFSQIPRYFSSTLSVNTTSSSPYPTTTPLITSSTSPTSTTKVSSLLMPMRASRVNNAIKSSIAAAAASSSYSAQNQGQATSVTSPMGRNHKVITPTINSNVAAAVKCSDSTSNAKCNEIPSRYLLFVLSSHWL